MRSLGVLLVAGLYLAVPLASQNVNLKQPGEISAQKPTTTEDIRAHAAAVQLQKDAKELGDLCAAVSDDMERVRQGLLSKEATEKLKRMEKLSKRVREELTQPTNATAPMP